MGIQGKFPASTSCAALCSFIVPTTQRMQFYHIRKILSRATDIRSSRRPSMFFFLTELPQEAPLHPSEGSQHSIREKETEWGFRCIQVSARTKCDHREKKKCRLVKPKVIQPVLFSRRLWMCSFCLSAGGIFLVAQETLNIFAHTSTKIGHFSCFLCAAFSVWWGRAAAGGRVVLGNADETCWKSQETRDFGAYREEGEALPP